MGTTDAEREWMVDALGRGIPWDELADRDRLLDALHDSADGLRAAADDLAIALGRLLECEPIEDVDAHWETINGHYDAAARQWRKLRAALAMKPRPERLSRRATFWSEA